MRYLENTSFSGKFLVSVGSHDSLNYNNVQLFAVGSGSSLSGCSPTASFPVETFYNFVGYMNDETILSCGGYDPQWVKIFSTFKEGIKFENNNVL